MAWDSLLDNGKTKTEFLEELATDGLYTAQQLGDMLGVSRNAVIGRVKRINDKEKLPKPRLRLTIGTTAGSRASRIPSAPRAAPKFGAATTRHTATLPPSAPAAPVKRMSNGILDQFQFRSTRMPGEALPAADDQCSWENCDAPRYDRRINKLHKTVYCTVHQALTLNHGARGAFYNANPAFKIALDARLDGHQPRNGLSPDTIARLKLPTLLMLPSPSAFSPLLRQ